MNLLFAMDRGNFEVLVHSLCKVNTIPYRETTQWGYVSYRLQIGKGQRKASKPAARVGEREVGGVTAYNGLYREAPPEKRAFLRLQLYLRVEIS